MATRITPPRSRHLLYGRPWTLDTNVQDTWRRYGWRPRRELNSSVRLALPDPTNPAHRPPGQIGFITEN